VALAVSWNAGAGAFEDFPAGLSSAEAAVERLDFRRTRGYDSWTPEDRWTKVVEIYDYVRWFETLSAFWRERGAYGVAPLPKAGVPGERCFDVAGERLTPAARRAGPYRRVPIPRLRFGRYEPAWMEVLPPAD
jgi:hypothetical protein